MPGPKESYSTKGGAPIAGTPKDLGPTSAGRELSEPSTSGEMIDSPLEMKKTPTTKDPTPAAPAGGRKAGDFKGTPENV